MVQSTQNSLGVTFVWCKLVFTLSLPEVCLLAETSRRTCCLLWPLLTCDAKKWPVHGICRTHQKAEASLLQVILLEEYFKPIVSLCSMFYGVLHLPLTGRTLHSSLEAQGPHRALIERKGTLKPVALGYVLQVLCSVPIGFVLVHLVFKASGASEGEETSILELYVAGSHIVRSKRLHINCQITSNNHYIVFKTNTSSEPIHPNYFNYRSYCQVNWPL